MPPEQIICQHLWFLLKHAFVFRLLPNELINYSHFYFRLAIPFIRMAMADEVEDFFCCWETRTSDGINKFNRCNNWVCIAFDSLNYIALATVKFLRNGLHLLRTRCEKLMVRQAWIVSFNELFLGSVSSGAPLLKRQLRRKSSIFYTPNGRKKVIIIHNELNCYEDRMECVLRFNDSFC